MKARSLSGSLLRRAIATMVVAALLTRAAPAGAQDPDPWFGRDKALHFGASMVLAGGTYAIAATQFRARWPALLLGAAVSLGAGTAKELFDLAGLGDPSWRDFTWDVIGTAVGLGIAWSIDLLVRGANERHPAFGDPSAITPAHALIRF